MSEAYRFLRLSAWRLIFCTLFAIGVAHLAGPASAESPNDRPFTVNWELSGIFRDLRGVHFTDTETGWAVGKNGTIVALRDGGASWGVRKSGTDEELTAIYFTDARNGWAVGEKGTVLATQDGGVNWKAQTSGVQDNLTQLYFTDARTGWVVGENLTVLATHDGGVSWQPMMERTPGITISGISFVDAHTGWVVGDQGQIAATQDGGGNWQWRRTEGFIGVHLADERSGWAVGNGGAILATRDGGESWSTQDSGTDKDLRSAYFADARVGWAVGEGGTILATHDGGVSWESQKSGSDAWLTYVYFADVRTGWVVGENGVLLGTRDGGASWKPQESRAEKTLAAVHFTDALTGWAVGDAGTILATRDGGASWTAQKSGADKELQCVFFADALTGWAVGDGGTILATHDGGASWTAQKSETDKDLYAIYFADARNGWMVGAAGNILATQDGGVSWKAQESYTNESLMAIHFTDARNGWAVGDGGTILATHDGGASWTAQKSADNLRDVYFADAQNGWAVGEASTIMVTRDGGTHWRKQQPSNARNKDGTIVPTRDQRTDWRKQASDTLKNLLKVHFVDARTGWAVGDAGTILATQDGGASWTAQKSDTDKSLSGIYFADARIGWAVGDAGTILATRDGGASWQKPRGDHFGEIHFVDERTGWVIGDAGTILATHDGGASWQKQASRTDKDLAAIYFTDARNGWAVGQEGTILATRDGGARWESQKSDTNQLLGYVVFADARTGWVVGNGGTILATRDGGAIWQKQRSFTDKALYGTYFADAHNGWVVGQGGTILVTHDGGAGWQKQESGTDMDLGRVQFVDASTGWALANKAILATRDGGASWKMVKFETSESIWSMNFANASTGWVVGEKGTILATRDGGRQWLAQKSSTNENLSSVRSAGPKTSWIISSRGTMLHAGEPLYAPRLDAPKVEASGGLSGDMDVSFALHDEGPAELRDMSLWGWIGQATPTRLGEPKKLNDGSGRWHVVWNAAVLAIHPGDKVGYHVRLDDGGPPLVPLELGQFTYDPWLARLWRDHQTAVIGALGPIALLLSYAGVFALMLLIAPARLARVGSAAGLDDVAKPSGTFGFVWELARKGFGHVTLPYLCRHPRVRRAWTERYREGRASLRELGKPARESFVTEPEVLDAWVQPRVRRVMAALDRLELYKQRRIYVELPVRVNERQDGPMIERPSAEAFRDYFAQKRTVIAVVGGGGSGKSTLACALARWAMADDMKERLAKHRMLPVLIAEDTTDLVKSVTRNLRRMLGDEELPDDLVYGLLAKQRLLVIVDALSEREPATQQHIEQVFGEQVPLNAIVITSRTEPKLGAIDRSTVYPVRLDAAHVVPFIIGYLDRMEHSETLKDGRVQLRIGERILALAEAGGHRTPVTPLLVTLFVHGAVDRAAQGGSFDDMPDAVPEVFVDYLRRLNSEGAQATTPVSEELFIQAAQILASVSLGSNLVPQDFLQQDAVEVLAKGEMTEQAQTLIDRLVASGLIERRPRGGRPLLRFSLDPAAEYLAAIRKVFELKAMDREGWQSYVEKLARREGYPDGFVGYLTALATCHRTYRQDFRLPDIGFPWEDDRTEL